ncbi:hypothetical protein HTIA_1439 [Halorhabdus tiamatea SARL4B]|nr:hypothetical protein HTIA_1439 [Halorhabdus tiamatea SARL4B]
MVTVTDLLESVMGEVDDPIDTLYLSGPEDSCVAVEQSGGSFSTGVFRASSVSFSPPVNSPL